MTESVTNKKYNFLIPLLDVENNEIKERPKDFIERLVKTLNSLLIDHKFNNDKENTNLLKIIKERVDSMNNKLFVVDLKDILLYQYINTHKSKSLNEIKLIAYLKKELNNNADSVELSASDVEIIKRHILDLDIIDDYKNQLFEVLK